MFRSYFVNITVAAILIMALAVLATARFSSASGDSAALVASVQQPAAMPKPDLIDDIIEIIEDIINPPMPPRPEPDPFLAELIVANNGVIPTNEKSWAADMVDYVEAAIEDLQDSQQYPSLSPANAGQPGSTATFSSLEECATYCAEWAHDALAEVKRETPDHAVIGYALDSILNALPQYRTLGGL